MSIIHYHNEWLNKNLVKKFVIQLEGLIEDRYTLSTISYINKILGIKEPYGHPAFICFLGILVEEQLIFTNHISDELYYDLSKISIRKKLYQASEFAERNVPYQYFNIHTQNYPDDKKMINITLRRLFAIFCIQIRFFVDY